MEAAYHGASVKLLEVCLDGLMHKMGNCLWALVVDASRHGCPRVILKDSFLCTLKSLYDILCPQAQDGR